MTPWGAHGTDPPVRRCDSGSVRGGAGGFFVFLFFHIFHKWFLFHSYQGMHIFLSIYFVRLLTFCQQRRLPFSGLDCGSPFF